MNTSLISTTGCTTKNYKEYRELHYCCGLRGVYYLFSSPCVIINRYYTIIYKLNPQKHHLHN